MSQIAEILRDCAYGLPYEECSDISLLDNDQRTRTHSPYICDHLDRMAEDTISSYRTEVAKAHNFLEELGMGTGLSEFLTEEESHKRYDDPNNYFKYTVKHQTMRAVFLLFAADLAEEWGV